MNGLLVHLTLALGIGANTAKLDIRCGCHCILLHPCAVPQRLGLKRFRTRLGEVVTVFQGIMASRSIGPGLLVNWLYELQLYPPTCARQSGQTGTLLLACPIFPKRRSKSSRNTL